MTTAAILSRFTVYTVILLTLQKLSIYFYSAVTSRDFRSYLGNELGAFTNSNPTTEPCSLPASLGVKIDSQYEVQVPALSQDSTYDL